MNKYNQHKNMVLTSVLVLVWLIAVFGSYAQTTNRWDFDIGVGIGYLSGDMRYQIGGKGMTPDGPVELNDPLSEIKYPFDVLTASIDGGAIYLELVEAHIAYTHNLNNPSGNTKDSDWDDESNPSLLTIYSESDSALKAGMIDGDVRVWAIRMRNDKGKILAALGAGAGYLYQNLSWDVSNVDQRYPQNPDIPHDIVYGDVMTYDAKIYAPYVGLYGKVDITRLQLEADCGFCFNLETSEADNHLLRYKLNKTYGSGNGIKADLNAKFFVYKSLYLMAMMSLFSFNTTGTQNQNFYEGPNAGLEFQIDEKSKSTQLAYKLAVGYKF